MDRHSVSKLQHLQFIGAVLMRAALTEGYCNRGVIVLANVNAFHKAHVPIGDVIHVSGLQNSVTETEYPAAVLQLRLGILMGIHILTDTVIELFHAGFAAAFEG